MNTKLISAVSIQPLEQRVLFAAADLDPTFSGDGRATLALTGAQQFTAAVAVQSDGKVVLAGGFEVPGRDPGVIPDRRVALARLNRDGSLDTSFGRGGDDGDGRVYYDQVQDLGTGRTVDLELGAADMVLLPSGKILVATSRAPFGDDAGGMVVLRLNPDGTLDTSFGGGDGVALASFGTHDYDEYAGESATALAVAPDGKIVVAGSVTAYKFEGAGVMRFNPDGTPDPTFHPADARGEADPVLRITYEELGSGYPTDVAVAPNGDIILVGRSREQFFDDFFALKIPADNSAGRLVTGLVLSPDDIHPADDAGASAVAIAPDGDILVGGYVSYDDGHIDFAVTRLNADLSRDFAFGGNLTGIDAVTTRFAGRTSSVQDLAVLPGGKVLAVGSAGGVFALARFNPDGSLDTTFDASDATADGRKTTPFSGGDASARAVAIAPDGKIVAAGSFGGAAMAVARYKGDPRVTPPPGGSVVYQAEGAKFSGANVSRSHPGYTGSGYVDFFTTTGAFIEWAVDAPAAGFYAFDFRYANGTTTPRTQDFVVNGKFAGYAGFFGTGSWSTWGTQRMTANLVKGRNTVRLRAGFSGPNIDSLTVTPIPAVQVLEAESASMAGAVVANNHPGYTGTGFVDFFARSGGYVEWTFNAPELRDYSLAFRYANGGTADRTLAIDIDGVRYFDPVSFKPTGSWSTWSDSLFVTRAAPGTHRVRLWTIGAEGPNLDSLTVR